MPATFAFIDTETTGLDEQEHQLVEVAVIIRHPGSLDVEHVFYPAHTLEGAEPEALEVNRYHERYANIEWQPANEVAAELRHLLDGVTLVGANPGFDIGFVKALLRKVGDRPTWHHRPIDVETLAYPLIIDFDEPLERPLGLAQTAEQLGIEVDNVARHGALYDAQLTRDVFDVIIDASNATRRMLDSVYEQLMAERYGLQRPKLVTP